MKTLRQTGMSTFLGILITALALGCSGIRTATPLGIIEHSLFVYIDGNIYECRAAGEDARTLDTKGSADGTRAVCTQAFIKR